jgi:hypothetical protein
MNIGLSVLWSTDGADEAKMSGVSAYETIGDGGVRRLG